MSAALTCGLRILPKHHYLSSHFIISNSLFWPKSPTTIRSFFNSNYFNISLRKSSLTLINPMILEQPTALTKSFVLIISIKNPGCQAVLGTFSPSSLSIVTIVALLYLDTILCMWTLPRSKYRTIFYYSWSLYNFAIELNLQCSASLSFAPAV